MILSVRFCFCRTLHGLSAMVGMLLLFAAPCARAQSDSASMVRENDDDWDVGFIHINEENQGKQIPSNYWPIEIKELQERLQQVRTERLHKQLNPSRIEEAIYVATLSQDAMISERSRWQMQFTVGEKQPVRIGRVSFALRDARNLAEHHKQLSVDLRFLPDGAIELPAETQETTRWFGFQSAPEERGPSRRFSFEIPPATLGRMIVAADSGLVLSSRNVVVHRIDSPTEFLPDDWPSIGDLEAQANRNHFRWWLVHLSGVSQFSLDIDTDSDLPSVAIQHAVPVQNIHYELNEQNVTVSASIELAGSSHGQPVILQLDPRLRIHSIRADGQAIPWRAVEATIGLSKSASATEVDSVETATVAVGETTKNASDDFNTVELLGVPNDSWNRIEIRATANLDNRELPTIQVKNALVIRGSTQLHALERVRIRSIESATPFQPIPESLSSERQLNNGTFGWQASWIGQQPNVVAWATAREESWRSEGVTRFFVRPSAISAITKIRLAGKNLRSNVLSMPVLGSWIVDGVQLPSDAADLFRAQIEKSASGTDHVVLRWDQALNDVETEIEITAHAAVEPNARRVEIQQARLLLLPHGLHPMYYRIEETEGCRLHFSPRLLQMIATERELPFALLPPRSPSSAIVFRDSSDGTGLFAFDTIAGTYSTRCMTFLRLDADAADTSWRAHSLITVEPESGSVDRVHILVGDDQEIARWQFQLVLPDGSLTDIHPVTRVGVDKTGDHLGGTGFDLMLPSATSKPFVMHATHVVGKEHPDLGERTTGEGGDYSAWVWKAPGFPSAQSNSHWLLAPKEITWLDDNSSVELLPRDTCCHPMFADEIALLIGEQPLSDFLPARIDTSQPKPIRFSTTGDSAQRAWIWRETLQHRIEDAGTILHTINLEVQASSEELLTIHLPTGWKPKRLLINQNLVESIEGSNQSLEVPLEATKFSRIRLELMSREPNSWWFATKSLSRPWYDVLVHQREESVLLSPRSLLVTDLIQKHTSSLSATANELTHPLKPWTWWNWLHFSHVPENDLTQQPQAPWHSHRIHRPSDSENETVAIWLVNRNTFSAMLLSFCLIGSAVSWQLLRRSWRIGCCVVTTMVLATLIAQEINPWWSQFALLLSQLTLLAIGLGALAWIVELIVVRHSDQGRLSRRSDSGIANASGTSAIVMLVLGVNAVASQASFAQSASSNSEVSQPSTADLYGVFLPSDEEHNPIGDYAYIPKQLRDRLYEDDPKSLEQSGPRILSANYVLKLRQNQREVDPVQECTVELRLLVTDISSEILLPISGVGLQWIGTPHLNGQPRYLHGRNFTLGENGSGIVFRSDALGVVQVRLQFKPLVREVANRQFEFDVSIPPVPNATLRISSSDQISNLTAVARGATQRTFLGDTIAYLGPENKLRVAWTESESIAAPLPAEQTAETWVHASGDRFVVACQLKIERSRSLHREQDLVIDPNWEPVGTVWGDAEVVTTASALFRRRNVIRVRFSEPISDDSVIRLLLVPKAEPQLDSLEVPFLSLDRVQTKGRYFWWSTVGDSTWTADVLDSRPIQADQVHEWGPFSSMTPRVGYQWVGPGIRLRRNATTIDSSTYTERTSLRIRASRTSIDYEANWDSNAGLPELLWVALPPGVSVPQLELNGLPAKYLRRDDGQLLMISMRDNGIGRLGRLRLSMELPIVQGQLEHLPRVRIHQRLPRQSTYQLIRGADVQLIVHLDENELEFSSSTRNQDLTRVLSDLEILEGQFDLSPDQFVASEIPVALSVESLPVNEPRSRVLFLDRTPDGWNATVRCQWDPGSDHVDIAFFEMPFSLRDGLVAGSLPFKFMPHADPSRTNLCIPIPAADSDGRRRLEFTFKLAAPPSARSLTLPNVVSSHWSQEFIVALPGFVEGDPVQWITAGRSLGADWHEKSGVGADEQYQFLSLPGDQHQVTWQTESQTAPSARRVLTRVEVIASSPDSVAGVVDYWIDPRGQISLGFDVPPDVEVLNVQCHNGPAVWSREPGKLRVALQPSFLPVQIQVMARWNVRTGHGRLHVPAPNGGPPLDHLWVRVRNNPYWAIRPDLKSTVEDENGSLIDRWASIVSPTISSLANSVEVESTAWLSDWRPDAFGFSKDSRIRAISLQASHADFDQNDDGEITVGELWSQVDAIARLPEPSERSDRRMAPLVGEDLWRISGGEVTLQPVQVEGASYDGNRLLSLSAIAGALLLATVLLLWTHWSKTLFAERNWVNWFIVTALAWLLIPAVWPSIIVAAIGGWAILSRVIFRRIRFQRLG